MLLLLLRSIYFFSATSTRDYFFSANFKTMNLSRWKIFMADGSEIRRIDTRLLRAKRSDTFVYVIHALKMHGEKN